MIHAFSKSVRQYNLALPQNVNYAVKSSYILPLLESIPDVAKEMSEQNITIPDNAQDIYKMTEKAVMLVLVY